MLASPDERHLHNELHKLLDSINVEYQYPEFIDSNHKPHVTKREGVQFAPGSEWIAFAAYLIEVIDKRRVIWARFELGADGVANAADDITIKPTSHKNPLANT